MRIGFFRAKTTIEDLSPIALANLVAAVCSETEADNKIAAHTTADAHHIAFVSADAEALIATVLELIDSASPEAAANVEFTGLDGELFLLFYTLVSSTDGWLQLQVNGVSTANYDRRHFANSTSIAVTTNSTYLYVCRSETAARIAGCIIISGKRVGGNNILTFGHFGGVELESGMLMINGRCDASGGDLSSILLSHSTGTITGKVKLYKVG